jgi:acyl-ACP thioesterase
LIRYKNATLGGNALPRNANKLETVISDGKSTINFNVKVSDLDVNLHTNNVRYIKWVTDTYPLDFIMNNVPVSAEINYIAESRYNDEVTIRTSRTPGNHNTVDHSVVRVSDGAELCRIRIEWRDLGLDSKTV